MDDWRSLNKMTERKRVKNTPEYEKLDKKIRKMCRQAKENE